MWGHSEVAGHWGDTQTWGQRASCGKTRRSQRHPLLFSQHQLSALRGHKEKHKFLSQTSDQAFSHFINRCT